MERIVMIGLGTLLASAIAIGSIVMIEMPLPPPRVIWLGDFPK